MTTFNTLPADIPQAEAATIVAGDLDVVSDTRGTIEAKTGKLGIVILEFNVTCAFDGSGRGRRSVVTLTSGELTKKMEAHAGGAGGGSGSSARDGININIDWVITELTPNQDITISYEITAVSGYQSFRHSGCWIGI